MFRLLFLGNGWANFVEIWYALGNSLVTAYTYSSHGWGISARAHVQTALLYLRNGLADWVQFWCVGFESIPKCFPQVMDWVSLHVRTCRPRFCISGTAWPIEFNFGVWVGGHELGAYHRSWVGYLCTCARAHRTSVSQKRLDRLCSNLVWGWASLSTCFPPVRGGWGIFARAHVHPHLRVSGSEWPIVLKFDVWLETQ